MHRYVLVYLYYKHRKNRTTDPAGHFADLPRVTVQLPIFNEQFVVERLVDAICRLQYPLEKLDVQVLDDSTDETRPWRGDWSTAMRRQGFPISYHHRTNREGFKAGALSEGMETAKGEFIAIFDADFVPPEDFLLRRSSIILPIRKSAWCKPGGHISIATILSSPKSKPSCSTGISCWNTPGRARSGVFFNFNGTAGVWRRTAIEEAGGWQHDTLTEDTDLSYRAQLKGWKFIYLQDVECPAELPVEMTAFKTQQARWAKGLIQTSKKILPSVMKSDQPFRVKLEAWYHLTANLSYPLMVVLSVLLLPAMIIRFYQGWFQMLYIDLPLFMASTFSISSFYLVSQRELFPKSWPRALLYLPFLMALGIGLTVTNTRAVLEALIGAEVGIRPHSEVSRGIEEGQNQRHQIPSPPGMGSLAGAADWQLFRAHGLLRHRQRKLHHCAISCAVRGGLLVHGVDVIVARALLGIGPQRGDAHEAISGWRVAVVLFAPRQPVRKLRMTSSLGMAHSDRIQFLSFRFSFFSWHVGLEFVPLRRSAERCRVGCSRGACDEPLQSNREISLLRSDSFSGQLWKRA